MRLFILILLTSASAFAGTRTSDFTYDVGLASASYNGGSYTEADIGLNWYAADWLAWRNAVFGRFQTDVDTAYGLDTSLRAILDVGSPRGGFTAFVGPGYRLAQHTDTAPFAEEGLVFHLGGVAIGGGAKQILNSWNHADHPNDNQYFLILGGGGSL